MEDEVLLEMMASLVQEMFDEGQGSEFRPAMQKILVAFNNRGLTQRAADEPFSVCKVIMHEYHNGICISCGQPEPAHR